MNWHCRQYISKNLLGQAFRFFGSNRRGGENQGAYWEVTLYERDILSSRFSTTGELEMAAWLHEG